MSAIVSRHTHTDTRKLILRTAREMVLTRSYLGLTFQDLADRVGIRKASLYHHFASKEALGLEVVADSLTKFETWCDSVSDRAPAQQILAYVRMFRDLIGAGSRVCPVAAFGSEWDCIEPELRKAVQTFHRAQLNWLTRKAAHLEQFAHIDTGPSKEAQARQWAAQLNATVQGAMVNARLYNGPAIFDAAVAPLVSKLT